MAEQIRYDHYLHGGDYNPEQWLDRPDILKKDIEYFKKSPYQYRFHGNVFLGSAGAGRGKI
ncbi:MAG: hypothetical protein ACLRNZ_11690 [Blautia massiliensis (ex Durand et al. 2017)]